MYLSTEVRLADECSRFVRDPAVFPDAPCEKSRRLIMGDIARVGLSEVTFVVNAIGSAPIERLDLFDGLDLIQTVRPHGEKDLGSRIRVIYEGAEYRGRARTTVWDGSLTVSGNSIKDAKIINNWNLDRGIQTRTDREISWKAVTTGNFGGIDLVLDSPGSGDLTINTKHARIRIPVAEIGMEDNVYEAGGLDRRIRLYRLPDQMTQHEIWVQLAMVPHEDRDTRLYVRVTQEDGHRAWSSPIYLFRG
jgi:hypothetical protein